jgi:signal transduction histidine kinase
VIRNPKGAVVAAASGLEMQALLPDPPQMEAVLKGDTVSRTIEVAEGDKLRLRTSPLTFGGEVIGILQVGEDAQLTTRPLDRLQTLLVAEVIGGVILALIIAYWLARGAVNPLQKVIDVAAEIEASDLYRRIGTKGSPREIQKLADTFDAMLERLSVAFQQQRNFVLDMSHELRTPLTALRGNIDVLLMDERLDQEARSQLGRMSAEVARLIRLTSNLLYLAHADAGREVDRRPVELDVLCLEVYRQTKDIHPEINFRFGPEDQVTVVGDSDLLKQLILNLVDNSLKYTPAGGEVTLSLYRDEACARIIVRDTGPGIEPDRIPLIFQRFYRAGVGGVRAGGGAGIGLAISDWIAKAHGGEITVSSEVGKGSVFTVVLPLASGDGGS